MQQWWTIVETPALLPLMSVRFKALSTSAGESLGTCSRQRVSDSATSILPVMYMIHRDMAQDNPVSFFLAGSSAIQLGLKAGSQAPSDRTGINTWSKPQGSFPISLKSADAKDMWTSQDLTISPLPYGPGLPHHSNHSHPPYVCSPISSHPPTAQPPCLCPRYPFGN